MYIFAWILFGLFIVSFTFRFCVVVGGMFALANGKKTTIDINLGRIAIDIAAFVFTCIYLFAR